METWKTNLDETKKRYIDWWNHKGIILNMWEHFQEGVKPHADIPAPSPAKDLNQKWFDPQWRAEYLDWYVAHSSLKADILPVANTQLGPGSLAAILGGVFEGGEDTIWIHPDPDFNDEIVFNPEHPNWIEVAVQFLFGVFQFPLHQQADLIFGQETACCFLLLDFILAERVARPTRATLLHREKR